VLRIECSRMNILYHVSIERRTFKTKEMPV
jgi:hypothetical protein